jgi:hypothetical protein
MIYYSSLDPVYCDNYGMFCSIMGISFGPGSARNRTPAETRAVAAFLYAVNSGRGGVFINFNTDLKIVVNPDRLRAQAWNRRSQVSTISWEIVPFAFQEIDRRVGVDSLEIAGPFCLWGEALLAHAREAGIPDSDVWGPFMLANGLI